VLSVEKAPGIRSLGGGVGCLCGGAFELDADADSFPDGWCMVTTEASVGLFFAAGRKGAGARTTVSSDVMDAVCNGDRSGSDAMVVGA